MSITATIKKTLGATAVASTLVFGAMGAASAAAQTEVITDGSAGDLANGVSWESTTEYSGIVTSVSNTPPATAKQSILTLSGSPTTVEFEISGLSPAGSNWPNPECVILPSGAAPISLSAHHSYLAETNEICGTGPQGNNPDEKSRFVVDNPGSTLLWESNSPEYYPSGGGVSQQILNVRVTANVEDVPVVSLPVLGAGAALAGAAFAPGLVKRARKNQDA